MTKTPDPTPGARPPTPIEYGVWWAGLISMAFFLTAMQMSMTEAYRLTTLDKLATFTAAEPFQHRVLIPALAAGLENLLGLDHRLAFGLILMAGWISLIWLAERALALLHIVDDKAWRLVLAPTLLLPMALVTLIPDLQLWPALVFNDSSVDIGHWLARPLFFYPYDVPAAIATLALFVLLIGVARRPSSGRLALLAVVFALATINRETTVFLLPLAAVLLAEHIDRRRLWRLLGGLLGVFLIIQLPLQWLFSGQPNPHGTMGAAPYEWHVVENWRYLSKPAYLIGELVRLLGGLWLPVLLWWRLIDRELQRAVWVFVVPLVTVGLIIGRVAEHRVFIEAVPLMWLAGVQALTRRLALS